ncbi:hypothetical protein FOC46_23210 [Citrobacter portucalensis]|uniref:hypothetical protein n=1 Tax=Citrobacter portucalensis TaxID=1639133 RepID=UPI0002413051|nr:hypothetical protein [Citrobacter portucalensis]EHL80588.1 hypothetical protein HMPREF9428_01685 [Citrobacter portucalensis]QGS16264.1 hypothetical protein FOC46_23210 [Citrobacter portucalensis]
MKVGISFKDDRLLSIKVDEIASSVPTFSTKREAIKAGSEYGWSSAICIERRFERIWIVGKQDFQNDYVGKLKFESFRIPVLRWEKVGGGERCPVLSVRRYKAA